jgi:hypothetical protein
MRLRRRELTAADKRFLESRESILMRRNPQMLIEEEALLARVERVLDEVMPAGRAIGRES